MKSSHPIDINEHNLVSVIVPSYRQKASFDRAVSSLLAQDYEMIEVIVIDDNKEEEFSNYIMNSIEQFSDSRIRYFKNENNIGSVLSRNKGVRLSLGQYITFLDDDDYYDFQKISGQLEIMKKNNADYSVCDFDLFTDNGIVDVRKRKYLNNNLVISNGTYLLKKHLLYHITGTSTIMMRKDFFEKIGGFSTSDFGDEFYLILNAIKTNGTFVHFKKLGVHAKVNSTSGLSSFENKIKTEQKLIKEKSQYFNLLSHREVRYVKMRHNLVLAYAHIKGKKYITSFHYLAKAFVYSPFGFLKIAFRMDK
jgi:glycosyltransferase involved in cell wall biosynthesis